MNILLINHYAGSVRHGMEFRPFYMAKEWVRAGHRVRIVAASHSHIRAVEPSVLEKDAVEIIDGVEYAWLKTPEYDGNGIGRVKNILAFIWGLWKSAAEFAHGFKPDVVIASSTYPMDIWPARRIARMAGARLVYEVHDLWPLSPIELGGMSRRHPFIVWVQYAEDYAYRHADKVVSMLPLAAPYMESRGMEREKFCYVPNGVDEAEWESPQELPAEIGAGLSALRKTGLPVVGYAGTHGLANGLDTLLDAAKLLSGEANIVLVGTGPERNRLIRRMEEEGIGNVTMLASVPKQSVPHLLSSFDIAYIGLLPQPLFRFGISPNKLMDYMMGAVPIVMAIEAGNDPVAEAECGVTVPPGDAGAIAEGVRHLIAIGKDERSKMGRSGKNFIMKNQTYHVLAQRFIGEACAA